MKSLAIEFDLFGDARTASSRLRGYKIAEQLNALGHTATIGRGGTPDIKIFQKNRNFVQLAEARKQQALTVFDFDDNYLLQDVGTKNDAIRMMNFADVVTVGSRLLYDTATLYHDKVYLFENPLDVQNEATVKSGHEWQERIGWFGNPCNLSALEALDLALPVTTITDNGDIPWKLETIDDELTKFDLVLIPVAMTEWTLSKNANRMLKCIALGVPFLASKTPEHLRTLETIGLDANHFLVGPEESWKEKIVGFGADYPDRVIDTLKARSKAKNIYGIETVTRNWLDRILELSQAKRSPLPAHGLEFLREVDVVIWNETHRDKVTDTFQSLRADEIQYRSITVVSALPVHRRDLSPAPAKVVDIHADFFDVYPALSRELESLRGRNALILRAGCKLQRGFFHELKQKAINTDVLMFTAQQNSAAFSLAPAPPTRMEELLLEPHLPSAIWIPTFCLRQMSARSARFAVFCLWELMIRTFAENYRVRLCEAPVMVMDRKVLQQTPITCYAAFLLKKAPHLAGEIPGLDNEWDRLRHTLQSYVIETHRGLFAEFLSNLLPTLVKDKSALARQAKWLRDTANKQKQKTVVASNGEKAKIKAPRFPHRLKAALRTLRGKHIAS